MTRTIYLRNLIIFTLFVAIVFAAPFVLASIDTSPSIIELNTTTLSLMNRNNPNQENFRLGPGDRMRLPSEVVNNLVYDGDQINMRATLQVWNRTLSRENPKLRPHIDKVNGKVYYPVKVIRSGASEFDIASSEATGWVELPQLLDRHSFRTVSVGHDELIPDVLQDYKPLPEHLIQTHGQAIASAEEEALITVFDDGGSGFSETTTPDGGATTVSTSPLAPTISLRPKARPADLDITPPRTEAVTRPHPNRKCENIRSRVAAALGESVNSRQVRCYLDLFHKETSCRPTTRQGAGNAGNPYSAYGLCSIEASASVRRSNGRGPECVRIDTVEQQTRCCHAMMSDPRFSTSGSYFGPVRRREVQRCDLL